MRNAIVMLVASMAVAGCGGRDAPPTGPTSPAAVYRITIGANGIVDPTEIVVPPGTRVLFTNNHGAPHEMTSDPHPEHDDCTELNQVGLLQPGQSKETGNLVTPRTCGFHDHPDFLNKNLQGRIVIR
jgi:hypothetical protein